MPTQQIVRDVSTPIKFSYLAGGPLWNQGTTSATWEVHITNYDGTLVASSASPNGWQIDGMAIPPLPMPMPLTANTTIKAAAAAGILTYYIRVSKSYYGSSFPGAPGSTGGGAVYEATVTIICMVASITLDRLGVENIGGGQYRHKYQASGIPKGGKSPFSYSWTLPTGATLVSGTLSSQSLVFTMVSTSSTGASGTLSLTITDSSTPTACTASASIGLNDTQTGPPPDPCSNNSSGSEDDCECQQGNCMPDPCQVGTSGNNQVGSGNGLGGRGGTAGEAPSLFPVGAFE